MALRSLTESYVIRRDSLGRDEREESARKLQSFMAGFTSRQLDRNPTLQEETGIGFKKN